MVTASTPLYVVCIFSRGNYIASQRAPRTRCVGFLVNDGCCWLHGEEQHGKPFIKID
jgi:hypothetical protein